MCESSHHGHFFYYISHYEDRISLAAGSADFTFSLRLAGFRIWLQIFPHVLRFAYSVSVVPLEHTYCLRSNRKWIGCSGYRSARLLRRLPTPFSALEMILASMFGYSQQDVPSPDPSRATQCSFHVLSLIHI